MRKITITLLIIGILLLILPLTAEAKIINSGTCGTDLTWTLDDAGTLTISGTGEMTDYERGYEPNWESQGVELKSVVITDGVTSIGDFAFSYYPNLISVSMPDSLTRIGHYAFLLCTNLKSITIPDKVTYIGNSAFNYCESVTSISVPASVNTILKQAFASCGSLTSITVDEANEYFSSESGILYNKDKSKLIQFPGGIKGSFTIPESVRSFEQNAFTGCGLTSITIPYGMTYIQSLAFSQCKNLTSIILPESISIIGDSAFSGCDNLPEIIIPDSVTKIGDRTFSSCSSLTSITIPDNVTSIGFDAFSNCSSLKSINIGEANSNYTSVDGILYDKNITRIIQCPGGINGDINIPEGITKIGNEFCGCGNITGISIPASVTEIINTPFLKCSNLKRISVEESNSTYASLNGALIDKDENSIIQCPEGYVGSFTVSEGIKTISSGAFANCIHLTKISIPESVTHLGGMVFTDCDSLECISIPVSITSIYDGVFSGCFNLTDVYYAGTEQQWEDMYISDLGNGILSLVTMHFNEMAPQNILNLPAEINVIETQAFTGLDNVEAIRIPPTITSISPDAFDKTVVLIVPDDEWAHWATDNGYNWCKED